MHFNEESRLLLQSGGTHAFPVSNQTPDDLMVNEGTAGRWMSLPISQEEVETLRSLPKKGKDEFKENVHKYIEAIGKDYPPLTAMPLDEAPYALG